MKELKIKYEELKTLAKEVMKAGNVTEYFKLLNEINTLHASLAYVKK